MLLYFILSYVAYLLLVVMSTKGFLSAIVSLALLVILLIAQSIAIYLLYYRNIGYPSAIRAVKTYVLLILLFTIGYFLCPILLMSDLKNSRHRKNLLLMRNSGRAAQ